MWSYGTSSISLCQGTSVPKRTLERTSRNISIQICSSSRTLTWSSQRCKVSNHPPQKTHHGLLRIDDLLSDLHRKVMPFIMRRDKMTVLSELPPKIIQDHYCTLTPIQVRSLSFVVNYNQKSFNRSTSTKSLKRRRLDNARLSLKA